MSLYKIKDFDPDYRTYFEEQNVVGHDLYAGVDKVGSVDDISREWESTHSTLITTDISSTSASE